MAQYDVFSGGLKNLKKDMEDYLKNLETSLEKTVDKSLDFLSEEIKRNASSVTNEEMRAAIINQTKVVKKNGLSGSVENDSQAATYSEFGTGIIGYTNPTADSRMGWKYMMNHNRNYTKGWRYKDPLTGRLTKTMGVASNDVFYRSSQITKEKMRNILKEELKKGHK